MRSSIRNICLCGCLESRENAVLDDRVPGGGGTGEDFLKQMVLEFRDDDRTAPVL